MIERGIAHPRQLNPDHIASYNYKPVKLSHKSDNLSQYLSLILSQHQGMFSVEISPSVCMTRALKIPKRQQTAKRFIITSKEAAILTSFDEDGEASLPELAVSAMLTLSEVCDTVNRLKEKEFVQVQAPNGEFVVELTSSGEIAQHALKHHLGTVIISEYAEDR